MAMPGETIASGAPDTCPDCKTKLELKVCKSNAYYVGTECECGPYSRESDYYPTYEDALLALESGEFGRSTAYMPAPLQVIEIG